MDLNKQQKQELKKHWEIIGLTLGVKKSELIIIKLKYKKTPETYSHALLRRISNMGQLASLPALLENPNELYKSQNINDSKPTMILPSAPPLNPMESEVSYDQNGVEIVSELVVEEKNLLPFYPPPSYSEK